MEQCDDLSPHSAGLAVVFAQYSVHGELGGEKTAADNIQSACPLILKTQGVTFSVSFALTSTSSVLYAPRFLGLEQLISILLGVYLCFCGC